MRPIVPFVLVLLGSAAVGNAAAEPKFSSVALAALDPTRMARLVCGTPGTNRATLDQRLGLAKLHSDELFPGSKVLPLFPGVARSSLLGDSLDGPARRYFDQGMAFAFGFNHVAAIRSFREARRLAPDCALCWWGEAMASGPNINAAMGADQNRAALAALARARGLMSGAPAQTRALIEAQSLRYRAGKTSDRTGLDAAYADAMLRVAQRYPDHDDIAVLAAEAAMNTAPWDYWDEAGKPRARIGEAVALIEAVMRRNPAHPQASHLYVHLLEKLEPTRAEAAADRLSTMLAAPLGHLVHMPAHIYHRVGRYADSVRVNAAAARADEAYLAAVGDDGLYRYGYYPHNVHFLVTSAQMIGDMRTTLRESARLARILDEATARELPWVQAIHAAPYFAAAQFASPKAILAATAQPSGLKYVEAMRHYARAVAFAHSGNRRAFAIEAAKLDGLGRASELAAMTAAGFPAPDIVRLAGLVAKARLASADRDHPRAIALYREAMAIERTIPYSEPAYWYYPVAQSLGASLYSAGRYDEARDAFRGALLQAPNNGWALFGLAQAERKLGNALEARAAEQALHKVWQGNRKWLRMERL